jgi:hypothetical protein
VQCSTRGRPAPGPPPDARIPTTDVTTSHTPARARILLVLRCLVAAYYWFFAVWWRRAGGVRPMTLLIAIGALIVAVASRAALLDPQAITRAVAAKVASQPGYKVGDLAA